ncbi:MAG: two-component system response regulator [Candidatus Aminicenantales bacterium]
MPKKILVVDDDQVTLEALNRVLATAGYAVLTASRGEDALRLAREENPDVVILDILMPDMDGGDVASALRSEPILETVPIIFLSSLITKKEEQSSDRKDSISFVSKPYDRKDLLKRIEDLL